MTRGIFVILLGLLAVSCGSGVKNAEGTISKYSPPQVPAMYSTPEQRAEFLAAHYWDSFPFGDTVLINKPDITEQNFVDYIQIFPLIGSDERARSINGLLDRAMAGDSLMFDHFRDLFERYFYDPNSPFRNEEYFIPVLRHLIGTDELDEIEKIRPRALLEMAMKNRVGDVAADFDITLASGASRRLSSVRGEYVLLFFNNPDCADCARVKEYISASSVFQRLIGDKRLTVVSVYPDKELDVWRKTEYPSAWVNGYNSSLSDSDLYDLRAIPNLYLLDSGKRVVFKDGTIEGIEEWVVHLNEK